ncbi:MAG: DNA-formamidopyrimidine glycosylase family protein [Candidatus Firestonebacteria bacterium]
MPELPDLEVFAWNLTKYTAGKKIKKVEVFKDKPIMPLKPGEFIAFAEQKIIKSIKRFGKQLLFTFDDGKTLLLHLMLHGELYYLNEGEKLPEYSVAAFHFYDKKILVFKDHTQWLRLRLYTEGEHAVDPISQAFTKGFFKTLLNDKAKTTIKEILIDQEKITGIGSAYADEICYNAKIRPQCPAGELDAGEQKALYKSVAATLKDAVKKIKKGMNGNITGEYTAHFAVHGKKKGLCPLGHKVATLKISGRGSEYCPKCQR